MSSSSSLSESYERRVEGIEDSAEEGIEGIEMYTQDELQEMAETEAAKKTQVCECIFFKGF